MEKIRDSKYELLRVVSMFMIVVWHVLLSKYYGRTSPDVVTLINTVLMAILVVHVNSFILVTGYYQCESKFRLSKLFSLNNAAWFYRVVAIVALTYFNVINPSKLDFLDHLTPIDLSVYWFFDVYLILYCISPFLNVVINKIDKIGHQKLLMVLLVIFSVLPSLTGQRFFFDNHGYSLTNFVFLYFIGAYFRKYPINFFDFYNITSKKFKRLMFGSIFWAAAIVNICITVFGSYIFGFGDFATRLATIIKDMSLSYDNPLVIIGAVAYFLWFGCLDIKSKFINKISALTFGVYLIHENPFVKANLYQLFNFDTSPTSHAYMIVPKVLVIALIIFVSCLLIEWFRQIIFKFIYKRKISGKIRQKFYDYLEELKTKQPVKRETVEN